MWNSIESTEPDMGPIKENRYDFSLFYIVFTVVFPFFFVNVFIAFVILTFQAEGDAQLAEDCSLEKNVIICIGIVFINFPLIMTHNLMSHNAES